MDGHRWRLEGSRYSFWAPDDLMTRDELEGRITSLEEDTSDSPCGALSDVTGWWTTTTPTTTEGVSTQQDRYHVVARGFSFTALRWNTDRLDYDTEQNTGTCECKEATESAARRWE